MRIIFHVEPEPALLNNASAGAALSLGQSDQSSRGQLPPDAQQANQSYLRSDRETDDQAFEEIRKWHG